MITRTSYRHKEGAIFRWDTEPIMYKLVVGYHFLEFFHFHPRSTILGSPFHLICFWRNPTLMPQAFTSNTGKALRFFSEKNVYFSRLTLNVVPVEKHSNCRCLRWRSDEENFDSSLNGRKFDDCLHSYCTFLPYWQQMETNKRPVQISQGHPWKKLIPQSSGS